MLRGICALGLLCLVSLGLTVASVLALGAIAAGGAP